MKPKIGLSSFGILSLVIVSGLLSGCAVYVQPPPPAPVVYTPPPIVQPAPVYIAPQPQPPPVVYVPAPAPQPEAVVVIQSVSDFYQPLQAEGRWLEVPGYGQCWTPAGVDPNWRPYTDGHWQRTDAGWYWVSDEPWGWATCHYGRWHLDNNYGWVWIPQILWAPAWVAWREGGGYTGWAPLPPEAGFGAEGNFQNQNVDPRLFVFVDQKRMLEPQRHQNVIINNTTIINNTINITKITVVNKQVINEGPRPDSVAKATGRKVDVVAATTLRVRQEAPAVAEKRNHAPVSPHPLAPNETAPTHNHGTTAVTPTPVVRPAPGTVPNENRPVVVAQHPPNQPAKPTAPIVHPAPQPPKPAEKTALTPQQKLELQKKLELEKKKAKPHSGSSTNAPAPPH